MARSTSQGASSSARRCLLSDGAALKPPRMCAHNTELGVQTTAELDPELPSLTLPSAVTRSPIGSTTPFSSHSWATTTSRWPRPAARRAFPGPPDEAEGVGEPGAFNNRLCGAPGADADAGPTGQSRRSSIGCAGTLAPALDTISFSAMPTTVRRRRRRARCSSRKPRSASSRPT